MANDCCKTNEDGTTYCALPANDQGKVGNPDSKQTKNAASPWQPIRGVMMFVIGCVLSPCCTPLVVPLGLALFAGTPIAVWASLNIGWVYGGLTLLSVVSFILGWRWLQTQKSVAPTPPSSTANRAPQAIKMVDSK
jgi:hypothetical protein